MENVLYISSDLKIIEAMAGVFLCSNEVKINSNLDLVDGKFKVTFLKVDKIGENYFLKKVK